MLIGGPGFDSLDGGPGDDILIEGAFLDAVTSASVAGGKWLSQRTPSVVNGKTVLHVGGKQRNAPPRRPGPSS